VQAHEHEPCLRLLAELSLAGESLARAATAGDVIGALAASHESRRLRAELARRPLPERTVDGDVAALQLLVAGGRTTASIVDAWRARPLPAATTLVQSPLGVACFTDGLLPATWDVARDLVVLVGPQLEAVATMLADLGQVRILAVVAPEDGSYPAPVVCVADAEEAARVVRSMNPCPPERVVVRGLEADAIARADEIAAAVHTALCDLRVHHNTISAFSRTWLDQGVANLDAIACWPSVAAVDDRLAGLPMIICAPGPSLAKNVAQLRAMRGKAIIVAVSHALRPLRAAGVVPDLVVTVDPQDVRYHFAPEDLEGIGALVNGVTVHPALWHLDVSRFFSLGSNGALDQWIFRGAGELPADVPGGGSVATTAFSLGLRWKCDPIVMVGLDLSFPGGRYYIDSSKDGGAHAVIDGDGRMRIAGWSDHFHAMKAAGGPAAARDRVVELPGWSGGTVSSSFMFAMFHRWFVETAKRERGGTRLLNCTEGGAAIDGMTHLPLADALATMTADVDITGALDAAVATIDPDARRMAYRHWRRRTIGDLRSIARLARAGASLAASSSLSPAQLARLERVERRLSGMLAHHDFIAMLAQRDIDAALDEAMRPASEHDYLRATSRLLEAAARTATVVVDALTRSETGHGR
jgi:hypothetical protein